MTRPMKDDIREAVFNLVGGWIPGKAVFDLFAGTGAMGLEAMSRGAARAVLIERHFPTVKIMKQNIEILDADWPVEAVASDTFFWARRFLADKSLWPTEPWAIFCCPPYNLYVKAADQLMELISGLTNEMPCGSLVVVESDRRFDPDLLPGDQWVTREYSPAVISVLREREAQSPEAL